MSSPCYTAKVMIKIKTANKNAKKLSKNNKIIDYLLNGDV